MSYPNQQQNEQSQTNNTYQNPIQYENYYENDSQNQEEAVYAAPPVFGVNNEETGYYDAPYSDEGFNPQEEAYEEPNQSYDPYGGQQNYYYQPEEGVQEEAYQHPAGDNQGVEEAPYERKNTKRQKRGEVVSTNQSINLTCTLAAFMGLFALFLYFADQRSKAVRRMSVQSTALLFAEAAAFIILWFLGAVFSIIPVLGVIIKVIIWLISIGLIIVAVFLKVQMMMRAYRGESYELPLIGNHLRRFE